MKGLKTFLAFLISWGAYTLACVAGIGILLAFLMGVSWLLIALGSLIGPIPAGIIFVGSLFGLVIAIDD